MGQVTLPIGDGSVDNWQRYQDILSELRLGHVTEGLLDEAKRYATHPDILSTYSAEQHNQADVLLIEAVSQGCGIAYRSALGKIRKGDDIDNLRTRAVAFARWGNEYGAGIDAEDIYTAVHEGMAAKETEDDGIRTGIQRTLRAISEGDLGSEGLAHGLIYDHGERDGVSYTALEQALETGARARETLRQIARDRISALADGREPCTPYHKGRADAAIDRYASVHGDDPNDADSLRTLLEMIIEEKEKLDSTRGEMTTEAFMEATKTLSQTVTL